MNDFPFVLPDKVYNVLKWVVITVLPAIAVLYKGLASVWGWPYAEQVVSTIAYVEAFCGAVLCLSVIGYNSKVKDNGDN